jgi:putative tricarboxylic transport membrane protein
MIALKKLVVGTVVALTAAGLSACGSGDSGGGGSSSGRVEVVTHNSVGGGSDVFTRQVIKTMFENDIIDTQWPVRNVPAGDSIGAMAYMAGRSGQEGVISQVTPTWIATPMTVEDAQVTLDQLTPIIMLAEEPQVVVASADSEYETLTDFIEDAKSQPGQLVQSGGSSTANDALTRLVLQDQEDASWKFLSFEETGSRITALLRGDADIMMGAASDFSEQVRAGDLKAIAVIGSEGLEMFPDATPTDEQGIDGSDLPVQFRAIMGAPDMPEDAVQGYQDQFGELLETDDWKAIAEESGLVTDGRTGDEFASYLEEQTTIVGDLLESQGLRKDQ